VCTLTIVKASDEAAQVVSGLVPGVRGVEAMRRWPGVEGIGVLRCTDMLVELLPGVLGTAKSLEPGTGVVERVMTKISPICSVLVRVSVDDSKVIRRSLYPLALVRVQVKGDTCCLS
jgi:hypothetical protein